MKRSVSAVLVAFGIWLAAGSLPADETEGLAAAAAIQDAFVKAIASAEKSVVSIARDRAQASAPQVMPRNRPFQGREPPRIDSVDYIPNEFGAGIIIDANGLILTNYHLVRGGPTVEPKPDFKADQTLYVRLADRRGFEARIFAADPRSDLAVLKIAATDLTPIRFGNASQVRKGQFVIALGNPYLIARDGSPSATWGIVSNLVRQAMLEPDLGDDERRRRETIQNLGVLMQVDTRLDLGTSGGALLNLRGELIGITTSLASIVGYEKSAGFAVPVDDSTLRIIETLRQGKEVEYGFLGVMMSEEELLADSDELSPIAAKFGQYGAAKIGDVVPNLPAARAQLKSNDLVLQVGDRPIYSRADLMREVGLLPPGTIVRMRIWRPSLGRDLEMPVEVGKWPVADEEAMITSVPLREPWRGVIYDYPTARKRSFKVGRPFNPMNVREQDHDRNAGLLVVDVLPNSPAAASELQPEDVITHVNRKPVRSPKEFLEVVQAETGPVQLQVLSSGGSQPPSRVVEVKPR